MRLEGKVALISGGARGQGAAEARLFAREGAAVVIGDILDEEGMKLEAELMELGANASYVHLDVTNADQWQAAVEETVSRYGKLDILVNNAGIAGMVGMPTFMSTGASAAYGGSKGAVRLLTKSTAIQYASDRIRCNSVHPGYIDTAMTERVSSQPALRAELLRVTPGC